MSHHDTKTSTPSRNPVTRGTKRLEAGGWLAYQYLKEYVRMLGDPRRRWTARLGYAAWGVAGALVLTVHALLVLVVLHIPFTPGFASLKEASVDNPSIVLSADGEEIVRYHKINRKWVELEQVSPIMVDALIATEDHRYYDHMGVDLWRTVGSVWHTLWGDTQGGSTLPMQLARNLYPEEIGQQFGPERKIREMITAVKLEAIYSKDEILELYLNTVPFLYNTNGIEMAARTYFGKPAAELDTLEAATLVGMLKGTAYYNPARNPERALARRNVVLGQMSRNGVVPEASLAALRAEPVELDFDPQSILQSRAPHFTAHLEDALKAWAEENGHDLYTDGLVIHTTLDMGLQSMAQQAMERQMDALQQVADVEWGRSPLRVVSTNATAYGPARENVEPFAYFWKRHPEILEEAVRGSARFRNGIAAGASETEMLQVLAEDEAYLDSVKTALSRLEAGFVAIDPKTGYVKAWVGSRNFYKDQYDHVARAKRQPGSTFKPFVYATALENGYSPADIFWDQNVEIELEGGDVWRPTNSGGVSGEPMTLASALAQSKNTITVQLMSRLGPEKVAAQAHRMGIESELEEVPSLALGTSDVSLLEMVSAYGTIASQGTRRAPVLVTRIEDPQGNVLATFAEEPSEGMDRKEALLLLDMMRGVVNEGTGQGLRWRFDIDADVAGKTGTTQNNGDGWFILMHPDLVAGSWVGFNDRRIAFRSNYWGQGAHNALFVVGDFYRQAFESGALDADAEFPEAPAYRRGRDYDLMDRLGRWFANAADEIKGALRGELEVAPRPPESPRTRREPKSWGGKDEHEHGQEKAHEQMSERERRRHEIAEKRAEKMYEEQLRRERKKQDRLEKMREQSEARAEAEGERVGW